MKVNQAPADGFCLDISVWRDAQARYLVHGIDDSYWTDNLADALLYLKQEMERIGPDGAVAELDTPPPQV